MADNELAALIPDPKPSWLIRAMDPKSPTTDQNETIRSASSYVKELGGEVLYPTIRMGEEGLYKPTNPLKESLDRGDYILVPGPPGAETASRATDLSKYISSVVVSGGRGSFTDKPLYDRSQ
jgi:hypothetical protein|tara:strand:- start:1211 stop:1576 length:366 start_codon:yes stop_codon:yes gene_type:complete